MGSLRDQPPDGTKFFKRHDWTSALRNAAAHPLSISRTMWTMIPITESYDSVQHVRPDCVVVGVVATIVVISSDDDNVRCDFCSSNRGCQLLHSLRVTLLGPEW